MSAFTAGIELIDCLVRELMQNSFTSMHRCMVDSPYDRTFNPSKANPIIMFGLQANGITYLHIFDNNHLFVYIIYKTFLGTIVNRALSS